MPELHDMIGALLARLSTHAAPPTVADLNALSDLVQKSRVVLGGILGPWRQDTSAAAPDRIPGQTIALLRRYDGLGVDQIVVHRSFDSVDSNKVYTSISGPALRPGCRIILPGSAGLDLACKLADLLAQISGFTIARADTAPSEAP